MHISPPPPQGPNFSNKVIRAKQVNQNLLLIINKWAQQNKRDVALGLIKNPSRSENKANIKTEIENTFNQTISAQILRHENKNDPIK